MVSKENSIFEKITMFENGKILSIDEEIAEYFNGYFTNITNSFHIDKYFKEVPNQLTMEEKILRAIEKDKDHLSIRMIKQHINSNTFKFSHLSPTEVMKLIDLLDSKKSSSGNIPTDMREYKTRDMEK